MIYYQKNRFHNDSIDIQNTAHHKKSHNQKKQWVWNVMMYDSRFKYAIK